MARAAGRAALERLSASDLFMLLWDDYGWSTDIGGLAILDGTSLLTLGVAVLSYAGQLNFAAGGTRAGREGFVTRTLRGVRL